MSVSLNPSSSLGFKRPFDNVVKQSLRITNHNAYAVAFKVKTTAPKHYCVRPNSGRVEPGETAEVSVMLQAMKDEPPLSVKCKDKFLIQSTQITPEKEHLPLQDIWNATDASEETKVHQQKLRVVYLPQDGHIEEEDEAQLVGQQDLGDPSRNYGTVPQANGHLPHPPLPEFAVEPPPPNHEPLPIPEPISHHSTPPVLNEPGTSTPPVEPQHEESHDDLFLHGPGFVSVEPEVPLPPLAPSFASPAPAPAPASREVSTSAAPVPAPAPAPPPVEDSINRELLSKYEEAQAEIERLRRLLATASVAAPTEQTQTQTEIRHRRRSYSDSASDSGSTAIGTYIDDTYPPQDGVPLQVVVIVALGVFITTYLFL